jgi:hypothetical protein
VNVGRRNALGWAIVKGYTVTDGVAFSIKFLDHIHGKWVRRKCCRIVDGVRFPLSFRSFIEWGESFSGVSQPLQFIHGPLRLDKVARQFVSGKTFEIRYVEDRLVNWHDKCGGERSGNGGEQLYVVE